MSLESQNKNPQTGPLRYIIEEELGPIDRNYLNYTQEPLRLHNHAGLGLELPYKGNEFKNSDDSKFVDSDIEKLRQVTDQVLIPEGGSPKEDCMGAAELGRINLGEVQDYDSLVENLRAFREIAERVEEYRRKMDEAVENVVSEFMYTDHLSGSERRDEIPD